MPGKTGEAATPEGSAGRARSGLTRRTFVSAAATLAAGACAGLGAVTAYADEVTSSGETMHATGDAVWSKDAMTLEGEVVHYPGSGDVVPASWAYWATNVPEAWSLLNEAPGTGVTVGIVDAPIWCDRTSSDGKTKLTGHEDLPAIDFSEQEDEPAKGWVKGFHGTVIAGIIAAEANNGSGEYGGAVGVAHGCTLANVSYNAPEVQEYVDDLFEQEEDWPAGDGDAFHSAYDAAARYCCGIEHLVLKAGARVINISGGLGVDDVLRPAHDADSESEERIKAREVIDDVNAYIAARLAALLDEGHDFVICKASGNSNSLTDPEHGESGIEGGQDAALDILSGITDERLASRIIVVGAATPVFPAMQQVAPFSGGGPRVDVLAPGMRVYSTSSKIFGWLAKNGLDLPLIGPVFETDVAGNGYTWANGTSFATPIVAGVAALVWQANPDLTGDQVKEVICSTATVPCAYNQVDAQPVTAFDTDATYNMVDAAAAVRTALEMRADAGTPPASADLPVGTFYATSAGGGGTQKSMTIDENGIVRISEFSGGMGQETTIPYQATLDTSVTTTGDFVAYLLTPAGEAEVRQLGVDGIVETFAVEGNRGLAYSPSTGIIRLVGEEFYDWVRAE